jgi:hypothetical protein
MDNATIEITRDTSTLKATVTSPEDLNPSFRLLLMEELFLLPLKLIRASSSIILVESSILLPVEQNLTMVSQLLVTPAMPGSSKTPGELHGVKTDTLELLRTDRISVVSYPSHLTHFYDQNALFTIYDISIFCKTCYFAKKDNFSFFNFLEF